MTVMAVVIDLRRLAARRAPCCAARLADQNADMESAYRRV
jgi:hypothetical protein